ncbi:MAG: low specificity L-threonine aldolase [Hyphomicrobiales bacterium]|nr:low specificity L-threonine aldolase [Hyphomicrobiales bacterium]
MNFRSDNTAGASEKVLAALIEANGGAQPAYGADELTKQVEKTLCEIFEHDVAAFLVVNGTAANSLALSCATPPWGAVLCHMESHIAEDECGAPEFFTGGAKLVGLPGIACKLEPATVAMKLERMPARSLRHSELTALSITQATEAGTIYTCDEIASLAEVARSRGLTVHMDGARFANALVALGCTPAEMTWKAGIDVLSFGGTKNGCLAAEAVIFFDKAKATEMAIRRKRAGHTLSKGRFLAAQMQAYLKGGHWLDLARNANAAAAKLEEALLSIPGVRLGWPRQSNAVFAILPDTIDRRLRRANATYHAWSPDWLPVKSLPKPDETLFRFVTSFRTSAAEIEMLRAAGQAEPIASTGVRAKAG